MMDHFEGKYGYIDSLDNLIIPCIFENCSDFYQDIAIVKIDNKYGYIDTKGQFIIKPTYNSAFNFHNGKALVYTGNNKITFATNMSGKDFALIDTNNHKIFTPDSIFFIDFSIYTSEDAGMYEQYYYLIDNNNVYLINPSLIPEASCSKEILKNAKNLLNKYSIFTVNEAFGIYFYSTDYDNTDSLRFGVINNKFYPVTDCKFQDIECFAGFWDPTYSNQIGIRKYYKEQLPIWIKRGLLKVIDQNDQEYYIDFNGTEYIIR